MQDLQVLSSKLRPHLLAYLMALSFSARSQACPLCHTSTADEVREGLRTTVQDKAIWMAVLLPFITIGGVIRIMNGRGNRKEDQ